MIEIHKHATGQTNVRLPHPITTTSMVAYYILAQTIYDAGPTIAMLCDIDRNRSHCVAGHYSVIVLLEAPKHHVP